MRTLRALLGVTAIVGVATSAIGQTAAPVTTNPNTKVYSYQQAAPAKAKAPTATPLMQQQKIDENPPHGSPKWWELQNRFTGGDGGG